jgi:hypothetical protein
MSIATFISTRFKKASFYIILLLIATSCDLFYDEGDWKTDIRDISAYNKVSIKCVSDIYYHYSDTFAIEAHYYHKHLKDLTTKVYQGSLSIENSFTGQAYTSLKRPQIHLYAPQINQIEIIEEMGAGFYCFDTLNSTNLTINFIGDLVESTLLIGTENLNLDFNKTAGYIEISGSTNSCNFSNKSEATIKSKKLITNNVNIDHQSSLDLELTINNLLQYRILRNGNLIIWGNPNHSGEALGTGKLILK